MELQNCHLHFAHRRLARGFMESRMSPAPGAAQELIHNGFAIFWNSFLFLLHLRPLLQLFLRLTEGSAH